MKKNLITLLILIFNSTVYCQISHLADDYKFEFIELGKGKNQNTRILQITDDSYFTLEGKKSNFYQRDKKTLEIKSTSTSSINAYNKDFKRFEIISMIITNQGYLSIYKAIDGPNNEIAFSARLKSFEGTLLKDSTFHTQPFAKKTQMDSKIIITPDSKHFILKTTSSLDSKEQLKVSIVAFDQELNNVFKKSFTSNGTIDKTQFLKEELTNDLQFFYAYNDWTHPKVITRVECLIPGKERVSLDLDINEEHILNVGFGINNVTNEFLITGTFGQIIEDKTRKTLVNKYSGYFTNFYHLNTLEKNTSITETLSEITLDQLSDNRDPDQLFIRGNDIELQHACTYFTNDGSKFIVFEERDLLNIAGDWIYDVEVLNDFYVIYINNNDEYVNSTIIERNSTNNFYIGQSSYEAYTHENELFLIFQMPSTYVKDFYPSNPELTSIDKKSWVYMETKFNKQGAATRPIAIFSSKDQSKFGKLELYDLKKDPSNGYWFFGSGNGVIKFFKQ